jgi:protein-disulfide isomerase-like protein with CxxC motif
MAKVEVVHATSPLCGWSWGYEPVINRLRMIYGKQVQFTITQGIPYTDRAKWLEDYGMTSEEAVEFQREILAYHQLPMWVPKRWEDVPESTYPAAVAIKAAGIVHGPEAERKLTRALMFATLVEIKDTSSQKVLEEMILACGLDNARMGKVASDGESVDKALGEDMQRGGHGANFYSLLVRDNAGTTVTIEQAYDPARVERAIDYLAGKPLKKNKVKVDVVGYAKEHGPVSQLEVQRVFALDAAKAKTLLASAEKKGQLVKRTYPDVKGAYWSTA